MFQSHATKALALLACIAATSGVTQSTSDTALVFMQVLHQEVTLTDPLICDDPVALAQANTDLAESVIIAFNAVVDGDAHQSKASGAAVLEPVDSMCADRRLRGGSRRLRNPQVPVVFGGSCPNCGKDDPYFGDQVWDGRKLEGDADALTVSLSDMSAKQQEALQGKPFTVGPLQVSTLGPDETLLLDDAKAKVEVDALTKSVQKKTQELEASESSGATSDTIDQQKADLRHAASELAEAKTSLLVLDQKVETAKSAASDEKKAKIIASESILVAAVKDAEADN